MCNSVNTYMYMTVHIATNTCTYTKLYHYTHTIAILHYASQYSSIQHAAVQYILDTVIEQLLLDKDRTFIYTEMVFARWWNQRTDKTKNTIRDRVKLYVIGGVYMYACVSMFSYSCRDAFIGIGF